MQVRAIAMRYQGLLLGFLENLSQKVTFGKTVLNLSERFFLHGNVPHLTLVLQFGDSPHYVNAEDFCKHDPSAPDPADQLTDAQKAVCRALCEWRNLTSKAEERPAYAIVSNAQLVQLVISAPQSKTAIKEVEGLGSGFCKKYGDKLLSLLKETRGGAEEAGSSYGAIGGMVSQGELNLPPEGLVA